MRPFSSTELAPLEFEPSIGKTTNKIKASTGKIAWLHSVSDEPGASFDIKIKDGLGRTKWEKKDCKSGNEKFGMLLNLPTMIGEDLEVEVNRIEGSKSVKVFLN